MSKEINDNSEGKKLYEVAFLLEDPSSEKTILDLLAQSKAVITNQSSINPLRLAYPIKKHLSAYFGYVNFEAEPLDIKNLSDALKLNNEILRFLIVSSAVKKPEGKKEFKKLVQPEISTSKSMLSNKALEEKLEEILK